MHECLNGAPTKELIQGQCRRLVDRGGLRRRLTTPVSRFLTSPTDRTNGHYEFNTTVAGAEVVSSVKLQPGTADRQTWHRSEGRRPDALETRARHAHLKRGARLHLDRHEHLVRPNVENLLARPWLDAAVGRDLPLAPAGRTVRTKCLPPVNA